ncbi:MAG: hydrogenase maturation nickel metallochaperone HypA [Candidatus Magnetomorum sp.]|nr:hydrogenase maturation nickel metallochaperone HypA [Candidatus Magnetomorum sp.]
MHEMGIALQIIDIAKSSIPENLKGVPVETVHVQVGKLSAVVPRSLSFCFDIAVKETSLEGAKLDIKEMPVTLKCSKCENIWTIDTPIFECEKCHHTKIEMLSGRELDIISIELAQDDP